MFHVKHRGRDRMLSLEDVKEICRRLSLEIMGGAEEDFSGDISCIVYYHDICECGDVRIHHRHIDIELVYGECYEIQEDMMLFRDVCELCDLPLVGDGQEKIVIFQGKWE